MATVKEALALARTHLNDDRKLHWSDVTLMPKVRQAHRELQLELQLNGLAIVREVSADFTITAGDTAITSPPTDIVDPIRMFEKAVGEPDSMFKDMDLVTFLPNADKTEFLRVWCWREEAIEFLGANTDRVIRFRYKKGLTVPTKVTDSLGLTFAELFIGPRVASIVVDSTGKHDSAEVFKSEAYGNLDKIIRMNVLPGQRNPVRKRPFGFRLRRNRRIV